VSLHVLSTLVVANTLVHSRDVQGAQLAEEIGAEQEGPGDEDEMPALEAGGPPAVALRFIAAGERTDADHQRHSGHGCRLRGFFSCAVPL